MLVISFVFFHRQLMIFLKENTNYANSTGSFSGTQTKTASRATYRVIVVRYPAKYTHVALNITVM